MTLAEATTLIEAQTDHFRYCEVLSSEECLWLINLFGTHFTAVYEGQLDYFELGTTPKQRLLAWLDKQKNHQNVKKT